MTKIVLFNSPPNSGKDTVGSQVSHKLFKDYTDSCCLQFKDPLYDIATVYFNEPKLVELATDRDTKDVIDPNNDNLTITLEAFYRLKGFVDVKDSPDRCVDQCPINGCKAESKVRITPREALIFVAECLLKRDHGQDFFGTYLANTINKTSLNVVIVTDCGFKEEVEPLISEFGKENICVVHLDREGCTFANDSRGYIAFDGITAFIVPNNGTVEECADEVFGLIKVWMED